jgi:hypothetical protein
MIVNLMPDDQKRVFTLARQPDQVGRNFAQTAPNSHLLGLRHTVESESEWIVIEISQRSLLVDVQMLYRFTGIALAHRSAHSFVDAYSLVYSFSNTVPRFAHISSMLL